MVDKYLLVGSAPYARDYWEEKKKFYLEQGYMILAFNNSWKIVYDHVSEWFIADDFFGSKVTGIQCGTVVPTDEEISKMCITPMARFRAGGYLNGQGGTMALNVMHIMFNRYFKSTKKLHLTIMGSYFV